MSTEKHNNGHGNGDAPFHETVTFEPRDINVGTVAKQLIYLGLTIVIALLICIPVLKFLTGMAARAAPAGSSGPQSRPATGLAR